MKIYTNHYSNYENFFVVTGPAGSGKEALEKSRTLGVIKVYETWKVRKGSVYNDDLKDTAKFKVVGTINLEKLFIDAILKAAGGKK